MSRRGAAAAVALLVALGAGAWLATRPKPPPPPTPEELTWARCHREVCPHGGVTREQSRAPAYVGCERVCPIRLQEPDFSNQREATSPNISGSSGNPSGG